MTEHEWLNCDSPKKMLRLLDPRNARIWKVGVSDPTPSQYKLRLWVEACRNEAKAAKDSWGYDLTVQAQLDNAVNAWRDTKHVKSVIPTRRAQLLREIIGNPFSPVALDTSLQTPLILSIARATEDLNENGYLDPVRLAILADALEEAGCTEEVLLRHLRGEQIVCDQFDSQTWWWEPIDNHVPGCWAVDCVLGLA